MTLALLIMAVGGAWAQSSLNVVELEVPKAWETDGSNLTAGDLTGFKASTFDEAKAWTGAPEEGLAVLIYAFDGEKACFVPFTNGKAGDGGQDTNPKNEIFGAKSVVKYYYTYAEPEITEWELKPDETGKNWILADMPAYDIELQVEYFAENNLFLSKDALADKASIAVKAGDLGVQFGDDGKSANTITEGTAMTVTYNGTKKVIGMKAEKKAAAAPKTITIGDVELTYADGDKWETIVSKNSDKIQIKYNTIVQLAQPAPDTYKFLDADGIVRPGDVIDPTKNYSWGEMALES